MNAPTLNPFRTLAQGAAGTVASGGSLLIAAMPTVETTLRVSALVLGCLVSLATLISLLPKSAAALRWLRSRRQRTRRNDVDDLPFDDQPPQAQP